MAKKYQPGIASVGGGLSTAENIKLLANIGWKGTFQAGTGKKPKNGRI